MSIRSKLNLFAASIIVAGALMLSSAPPAEAALADGCASMKKRIMEEGGKCTSVGGSYTYVGSCTSSGYELNASCEF